MATSHGGPLAGALHDLHLIFGDRLLAFAAYGAASANPAPSVAIVRTLTAHDLERCAGHAAAWHRDGCATPLLLTHDEFAASLDAFPIEYGEIIDTHRLLFGENPFAALAIEPADMRRACEVLVKSHLVHLRENFIECRGRQRDIAALVQDAAPAFRLLLRRLARLDGAPFDSTNDLSEYARRRPGLEARTVGDVLTLAEGHNGVDAARIYPAYLQAVEQLRVFIDTWRAE